MKILITGIGGLSAAGINMAGHLKSFQMMKRNAGPVSLFDTSLPYPVFEIKNQLPNKQNKEMRTLSLAMYAVKEALHNAELQKDLSDFRAGVCLGTSVASQLNDIDFYQTYRNTGKAGMDELKAWMKLSPWIHRGSGFLMITASRWNNCNKEK